MAWTDLRHDPISNDIYAQRVNSGGIVQWSEHGAWIAEYSAVHSPLSYLAPQITPDGSGGATLAWVDEVDSFEQYIYAQRIGASGIVQWPGKIGIQGEGSTGTEPRQPRP